MNKMKNEQLAELQHEVEVEELKTRIVEARAGAVAARLNLLENQNQIKAIQSKGK